MADANISRADFIRGKLKSEEPAIRPPGARHEKFARACDGCGECVSACPESIIGLDGKGRPFLSFDSHYCTFCGNCANACPTGALIPIDQKRLDAIARPNASCLSFNGIVCRACEESCEEQAISFKLLVGGRSLPLVQEAACTGCGACAAICPTDSVSMINTEEMELAI